MHFKKIARNILLLIAIQSAVQCSVQKANLKAVPEVRGGLYTIRVQNQVMEIDPALGGRITSLSIDGRNFLTGKEINNNMWGSTFWPSPQAAWNWPPSPELDNKPYSIVVENNTVKMVSQKDPKFGWIVTKEISGNERAGSYTLKFTINNASEKIQSVAPWEVTRVHIKGLTFFPYGGGTRRGGLIPPITVEKDGISWFLHQQDKLPTKGDRQLYTDGSEGWLAHINDGIILVKKFPDIPLEKNAPSTPGHEEGEVELFASAVSPTKGGYVEIEHQGAYEELKPGESLNWEVTWILRKLPENIKTEAGNRDLAAFARKLVK